jgi:signal transduction histidine kinase
VIHLTRTTPADMTLAVGVAVLGFAEARFGLTMDPEPSVLALTAVLAAAPLAARRTRPVTVLAAVLLAQLVQALLGSAIPGGLAGLIAAGVAVYTAASATGLRPGLLSLAGSVLGFWAVVALSGDSRWGNYLYAACIAVAAWLAGRAVRLTGERSALLAERRATQERARIAAELHDVVSHHVSAIVVRAAAERRALPEDEPQAQALHQIEEEGRETLHELRRLLGVLRTDDRRTVPTSPQPGLAELPALVASSRGRGVPATLSVEGGPQRVGEGLALVVYRVVQESLTNAAKHLAAAQAHITLHWTTDLLAVEVLSTGRPAAGPALATGGGFGLRGMAERVRAYGGALEAEPTEHGFRVRARFPLGQP